ncbi:MAG: D-Ala-D-Ala carboxypeptidase family metallohydrolase [Methylotenera sp.]|nr:D-Ala-D-Ala carboxypeptidase family metallohydrolase [Methylotenera sp.]
MQLTEHFSLAEFTQSDYALRNGIANIASPNIIGNLKFNALGMEKVRALLGGPINISSGYRCPALNKAIGGSATSAHCLGFATDFTCRKFGTPEAITIAIKNGGIQYDQLICEGGVMGWVHISFAPNMRQQTLRALFNAKGKVSYRSFI